MSLHKKSIWSARGSSRRKTTVTFKNRIIVEKKLGKIHVVNFVYYLIVNCVILSPVYQYKYHHRKSTNQSGTPGIFTILHGKVAKFLTSIRFTPIWPILSINIASLHKIQFPSRATAKSQIAFLDWPHLYGSNRTKMEMYRPRDRKKKSS